MKPTKAPVLPEPAVASINFLMSIVENAAETKSPAYRDGLTSGLLESARLTYKTHNNPHKQMTLEADAWQAGFDDAKRMLT